jgi:hypothetical protein
MESLKKNARVAGFLYFLLALVGPIRLIYVPAVVLPSNDPAVYAQNILAHETLFRVGILSDLLTGVLGIFVALALFRLFRGVDVNLAALMVMLGGPVVAAIYFANTLGDAAALALARGGAELANIDSPIRTSLITLFIRLHHHGVVANEIFWGLWLFPFGLLVFRSRFLPRILGVWLIVNGCAYLLISLTGLLWPQYEAAVANYSFPALTGELAIMLWLLIVGARERPTASP